MSTWATLYMYLHFPFLKTSSFVASDRRLGIGAWTTWSLIGGYISNARGISTSLDVCIVRDQLSDH